jgi:hypothetical protein
MTIAPASPRDALRTVRVEVAWTVSGVALGGPQAFASAVLHVNAEWSPASEGHVALRCALVRGASRTDVPMAGPLRAETRGHGAWHHVRVTDGPETLIRASFENGRLVYATGALPARAGLAGGTYEAPSGTLDVGA